MRGYAMNNCKNTRKMRESRDAISVVAFSRYYLLLCISYRCATFRRVILWSSLFLSFSTSLHRPTSLRNVRRRRGSGRARTKQVHFSCHLLPPIF